MLRPGYLRSTCAGLLGGATVVAYPSLGEGFGLPVLEAMACGAPVLTTRRLSLPEVGGDAVAYTEPDPARSPPRCGTCWTTRTAGASWAAAAGARAALFDWRACARAHLASYAAAAEGPATRGS